MIRFPFPLGKGLGVRFFARAPDSECYLAPVRVLRSTPLATRLARLVAGEAAPKERVRVVSRDVPQAHGGR
jgi:hypothetical protein